MMKTNTERPAIGQPITVRGIACRITKVRPFGTVDVLSLCGNYAYRVSGLPFVSAPSAPVPTVTP